MDKDEIKRIVGNVLDGILDGFVLLVEIVDCMDDLSPSEKEWAKENLTISVQFAESE